MESEVIKRKRSHYPDRITLDSEAFARIKAWSDQVNSQLKGSSFSRNDMVNFLIKAHSPDLSNAELKSLVATYFNTTKALLWYAEQAREAERNGKDFDLGEVLRLAPSVGKKRKKSSSKKTNKEITPDLETDN